MQINLYYTASENNQLQKDLISISTLTGVLRNESNVVNPVILIEADTITNCNYAEIPEFNRYYFIKEIESVRNGLWRLSLESDPLMSFKDSILALYVILQETENTGIDNYLSDDRVWVAKVKDKTSIIPFSSGLSENGDYILITAGG